MVYFTILPPQVKRLRTMQIRLAQMKLPLTDHP